MLVSKTKAFAAIQIFTFSLILLGASSCSKTPPYAQTAIPGNEETMPIGNFQMKNCRFNNSAPHYTYGAAIAPNYIQCDEGLPATVQKLSPAALPQGMQFSNGVLGLTGTPTERVIQAPYEFYLENPSGYQVIKIQISIQ